MNAHEVMLAKGISYRKTVHTIEESLKPLKLTTAEWLCLGAVASGNHRSGEVARILGVTKGMASRQLNKLQARNYISESTAQDDGRERHYSLTDLGVELLDMANNSTKENLKQWLSTISDDDIGTYIRVLQAVSRL